MGPLTSRLMVLESRRGWLLMVGLGLVMLVLVPVLNLAVPADSIFHVRTFWISILGKYLWRCHRYGWPSRPSSGDKP